MPCLSGFAGRTDFSPETAAEAFTTRPVFRREPAAFIPCRHESGVCLIFIRRPAIHMFRKRTPPGSGQKERPPWQAAVFEEEVLDVPGFTVREGRAVYFQSGRTVSWENCRAAFCRSTASGRGGPPWQTAVRELRCLVQVLFMRLGFQKPSA